uniref:Uncharacterized protein n=1 Tax=Lotharella oceanica TaxID=641309 RepID=A0A7S2X9Z7_9EUKA
MADEPSCSERTVSDFHRLKAMEAVEVKTLNESAIEEACAMQAKHLSEASSLIAMRSTVQHVEPHHPQLVKGVTLKFIHIPKTAGTTIEDAGYKKGLMWGRFDKSQTIRFQPSSCINWHKVPRARSNEIRTFCIMRKPWNRIMSEVRYELVLEGRTCCGNPELNWRLDYCSRNGQHFDCHWVPQYRYLKHCDHILRFEHLDKDFKELMGHYNLPVRLNLTRDHSMNDRAVLSEDCHLNETRLSAFGRKRASTFYKADFMLYKFLTDNVLDNGMYSAKFRKYFKKLEDDEIARYPWALM